ncbi:MAG: MBL fold hydrolase [Bacteroidetes bacterium]|nr:MAG: MBL fold hydrolase [Bacteroidota bacterium]
MIRIETLIFNPFQVNTYLLSNEKGEAIVVDPAFTEGPEQEGFDRLIVDRGYRLCGQLNTHCHVDHLLGVMHLKNEYELPLRAHKEELMLVRNARQMGEMFGLTIPGFEAIDVYLEDGEQILLGEDEIRAIHVPGHSPGSLAFLVPESRFVITGDALFRGSIGRTDLPGGNYDTLIAAIQTRLLSLPPEYLIYPGHGPSSTIGRERNENPFL